MLIGDRVKLSSRARKAGAVGLVALTLAGSAAVSTWGPDPAALAPLGYPGIALVLFLASSTVLFPAPGFAAVMAAGAAWNPWLVGLAAGIGAGAGEMSGYLVGAGGGELLDKMRCTNAWICAHRWLTRYGFLTLFLIAATPNPFFDAVGMVAGSLSYPVKRFWLASTLGKCVKYTVLAWLSNGAVAWWLVR